MNSDTPPAPGSITRRMESFQAEHRDTLAGIWFCGDVHGDFRTLMRALEYAAPDYPRWLVLLGDVDLGSGKSLAQSMAPAWELAPGLEVAFIHGNHDADSEGRWRLLHESGRAHRLHGLVMDMGGVLVAGLGGTFDGQVWLPPTDPRVSGRQASRAEQAAAIYPDELSSLSKLRADILVTHEAPSCHPRGFSEIDKLARSLCVVRLFHGHHHDDLSDQYALQREALGFDVRGVDMRGIHNGLGDRIAWGGR